MRKLAVFVACVLFALGGVAVWQFTTGAQAASTSTGSGEGYGAMIGTSIPDAPATPEATTSFPTNPDPKDRVTVADPPITPKPLQGAPAIAPTRPEAPINLPTFDAAAAVEYALNAPGWQHTFLPSGPVAIASVEFLNGAQLGERGVSVGIKHAVDRLFCVVFLTGDFNYPAPLPGAAGPLGQPKKLTRVYVYFDARTGNYMGMGSFGD